MAQGDVLEVLLSDADVVQDLIMIVRRSCDDLIYHEKKADCICLGIRKGFKNLQQEVL